MKKFALKATVAATALLASSLSMAAVDLDAATGVANFAKELVNVSGTAASFTLGGSNVLDVDHKIGFGVSSGQNRYLRYTLTNATFANAVAVGDVSFASDGGATAISVVQGGGAGDNFVIFQITPDADFLATEAVTFALDTPQIQVADKTKPVELKYALYGESASDAANQTNAVYTKSGTIATFATGLALSAVTATTTADVSQEFKAFKANPKNTPDGRISAAVAAIGTVTFDVTSTLTPDGANVAITDLVANGTKLVANGDLTARGSLAIGTTSCAATSTGGTNLTDNSADLVTNTATVSALPVCYTVNTTTPVPISSYTIAADVVAAAGAERATPAAVKLGDIDHDGTTLKFPAISYKSGSPSWIQLVNQGTVKATFAATCYTPAGASFAGTPGSVDANQTKRFELAEVCGDKTKAQSIIMTLDVPSGSVNGAVIRKDGTTGAVSSINASAGNQ